MGTGATSSTSQCTGISPITTLFSSKNMFKMGVTVNGIHLLFTDGTVYKWGDGNPTPFQVRYTDYLQIG
jgi:hypothetical protein